LALPWLLTRTPDATTVKKHMTPDQLALGDPVVNSIGMVLVPIPAGEFQMGSPDPQRSGRSCTGRTPSVARRVVLLRREVCAVGLSHRHQPGRP
jgi:formylglycine-generating enzyme required for sulfatase activity